MECGLLRAVCFDFALNTGVRSKDILPAEILRTADSEWIGLWQLDGIITASWSAVTAKTKTRIIRGWTGIEIRGPIETIPSGTRELARTVTGITNEIWRSTFR